MLHVSIESQIFSCPSFKGTLEGQDNFWKWMACFSGLDVGQSNFLESRCFLYQDCPTHGPPCFLMWSAMRSRGILFSLYFSLICKRWPPIYYLSLKLHIEKARCVIQGCFVCFLSIWMQERCEGFERLARCLFCSSRPLPFPSKRHKCPSSAYRICF